MSSRETVYVDLHDALPDAKPSYATHGDNPYWKVEREVLSPALEAAGYELRGDWFTGERDSFGPLTRCVRTTRGIVVYG